MQLKSGDLRESIVDITEEDSNKLIGDLNHAHTSAADGNFDDFESTFTNTAQSISATTNNPGGIDSSPMPLNPEIEAIRSFKKQR